MRKLTRKLFISILAAVFAVVALGTSTFAWITITNTASVDAFEGTVEAGSAGIEISLDGTNFKSKLTKEDIAKQLETNKFKKFTDLTSTNGVDLFDGVIGTTGTTEATAGTYIEFTLHVRRNPGAAEEAVDVYVDSSKVAFATTSGTGEFTPTLGEGNDLNGKTQINLFASNAARLSITGTSGTVVYEQNDTTNNNTVGHSEEGFATKYAAQKGVTVPTYSSIAETIQAGTANTSASLVTLNSEAAAELKVRVWIEGFDNECHEQILNHTLSVAFALTTTGNPTV